MSNREIMRSALNVHTIPYLRSLGFTGKYPHFRRESGNSVDLLSFQTNKWGGAFTVEVSAIFPGNPDPNYKLFGTETEETLTVFSTVKRYRLKGMYDGWFHYWDLYRRRTLFWGTEYLPVSEKDAPTFVPTKGFRLFLKFDMAQAEAVCRTVNTQLENAFSWLEQFKCSHLRT